VLYRQEVIRLFAPLSTHVEAGSLEIKVNECGLGSVKVDGVDYKRTTRIVLDIVPGERVKARLEVLV